MCGIAGGVWSANSEPLSQSHLEKMLHAIRHRGPDDYGVYFSATEENRNETLSASAALGHRRLSIIDLSGGRQPLSNEDGTVWVSFNGEIYNYRELRKELIQQGHVFRTDSDTEVIVHLYEEYGVRCVDKMRGMFVFAVWDESRERLLLARDRLGQKPLFYRQESGRLLFASELKAILQVPGIPLQVNRQAIDLYLTYQYIPHPTSILTGFQKLPPASIAVYERNELTVERYWKPPYDDLIEATPTARAEALEELRSTLTEAVRLRMRSDVPLGAFLSGGIDSTIIAGLMQSLSEQPVHTFSIGFPVHEYDERAYAREAAKFLGTEHHEFLVDPSALETLSTLIWHYDEPFSDSSAIPTMALSEVTRKIVTVALSGDGSDELFAGYHRYRAVDLAGKADWLPGPVKAALAAKIWQKIPTSTRQRSLGRRAKRFIAALGQSPERRYLRWIGIFDEDSRHNLYTREFQESLNGYDSGDFIDDAYAEFPNRDFLTRTTAVDVMTYLPCDILTKVDIASMCHSLEARSPFLDHHVVELAARMPIEWKYSNGKGKQILIDAFSDLIPESIQNRSKMGFGVPIDHWFRNELKSLMKETLLSDRCLDRGYFRPDSLKLMIDEHLNGRWDHSYRLWNLVCLEHWHRVFLEGDRPEETVPA
ncbi:asparagine synthase (glutamine-hydrolyzing) [Thalassoglobus sp. JC818]|uniref:asparagine synthase (glutamine-hydrolyzing) n=1 Tax=Thalassoglobus sp. JC818 TaxID=3232136 RepID=UPI0034586A81